MGIAKVCIGFFVYYYYASLVCRISGLLFTSLHHAAMLMLSDFLHHCPESMWILVPRYLCVRIP